jgi:hypothetical protein
VFVTTVLLLIVLVRMAYAAIQTSQNSTGCKQGENTPNISISV